MTGNDDIPVMSSNTIRLKAVAVWVCVAYFCGIPALVRAEPTKPIVAVMTVQPVGLKMTTDNQEALSILITGLIAATDGFAVVPRDEVNVQLIELKKDSHKDCFDQSCQIELGQALAAHKTISTQILRISKSCVVQITLFDLRTQVSDKAASIDGDCSDKGIADSLRTAVAVLTDRIPAASVTMKNDTSREQETYRTVDNYQYSRTTGNDDQQEKLNLVHRHFEAINQCGLRDVMTTLHPPLERYYGWFNVSSDRLKKSYTKFFRSCSIAVEPLDIKVLPGSTDVKIWKLARDHAKPGRDFCICSHLTIERAARLEPYRITAIYDEPSVVDPSCTRKQDLCF